MTGVGHIDNTVVNGYSTWIAELYLSPAATKGSFELSAVGEHYHLFGVAIDHIDGIAIGDSSFRLLKEALPLPVFGR